jgi:hypothetical protein
MPGMRSPLSAHTHTHPQVIHVTATYKRPVPLEHQLYFKNQFFIIGGQEGYDPKVGGESGEGYEAPRLVGSG